MGKESVTIQKEELERLYLKENKPLTEIGKIFKCDKNTVAYKMKVYGIKRRSLSEAVKLFVKKKKIEIPEDELIELYEKKGLGAGQIAKIYGCGIATIHKRLGEYGIKITPSRGMLVRITKKELELLYSKKKLTTYEIADIYNCCQATIWKRLHQFDIKPRNPHALYAKVPSKKELAKLYSEKGLSTWEIQKKYGYSRSTLHRKLREYGIEARNPAKAHMIYPRKDFSGNLTEKAYLIGFKLGDLRARKRHDNSETIHVDCGSTKAEQINLIHNLFGNYGRVWISGPTKSGKRQIEAHLNLSFSFLLDKTAPEWIFNNKRYFFPFLAGFTDAEGCISISKKMAYFRLGNYDKALLERIRDYLNAFGITCNRLVLGARKGYIGNHGYVHSGDYWSLAINRKSSLLELFKQIRPHIKHEKKIKDLNRAERNIMERNKRFRNNAFPRGGDFCV